MAEPIERLIEACLRGDEAAIWRLVHAHQERVFKLCWRMLGHRQDAEDTAQEAFVRAIKNLGSWDPTRPFEPWLLTIAANRCRTLLTKRRLATAGDSVSDWIGEDPSVSRRAEQLDEEIQHALAQLRTEYRRSFELVGAAELSYVEAADALEVPVGTVKTWVRRARQEIVARLIRRGVLEEKNQNELRACRNTAERAAG